MLIEIDDGFEVSIKYNDDVLTLLHSYEWSLWLIRMRNLALSTVRDYMHAMDLFWTYSLYCPPKKDQSFSEYLAEYRYKLLTGIDIKLERNRDSESSILLPILNIKPKSEVTINKEIHAINLYFFYTEENELITNKKYINYLYEKKKSSKSFLSSIQIKKSSTYLNAYGKRETHLKPFKIIKSENNRKYFPLELFDELLKISNSREQLIYILCGICSARIGQALNLTLYDIDYDNKEIWLLDPLSDNSHTLIKTSRRKWLQESYNINAKYMKPHCGRDLQFKYPIPLNGESLYWLDEDKYKDIFFNALIKYQKSDKYLSELKRFPIHPFLFVTKTGNRLRARSVQKSFENSIFQLKHKFPKFNLEGLSIHSLRHMFGHTLAEHYALTGDESLIYTCKNAMGHRSLDSTLIYFKMSTKTIKNKLKNVSKSLYYGVNKDEKR